MPVRYPVRCALTSACVNTDNNVAKSQNSLSVQANLHALVDGSYLKGPSVQNPINGVVIFSNTSAQASNLALVGDPVHYVFNVQSSYERLQGVYAPQVLPLHV